MSDTQSRCGAVRENSDPESARPAQPATSRGEGSQVLCPPRPGQPHQAEVLKTLAGTTAVFAVIGLAIWLLLAHPFLTILGGFVLLIIVSIATDTGTSPYSGTTPSTSAPAIPRERGLEAQVARERERADAAVGGLILGLALGYWFFDD